LLAPFTNEWMRPLELLADATGSSHGELIGWKRPNKTPFKLISNLSDSSAKLIREWEEQEGADPAQNPIIERGVRARILEAVSDEEIISRDDRKRHRVWNEFYNKLDMPHMCFVPLWRDGDNARLGLFLLRTLSEGPIQADERKVFAAASLAWYNAATASRTVKDEGARVLVGAFDKLSMAAIVLDGFGRCTNLSPAAEALVRDGQLIRMKMGNIEIGRGTATKASCALSSCVIQVSSSLQPCMACLVKSGVSHRDHLKQSCSLYTSGPHGLAATLRVLPLPRNDYDIGFGATAVILIETSDNALPRDLAPAIAVLLTPAEIDVSLELLNGRRPAEIAARRHVTVETVRTQIKRIYSKAGVSSALEFIARARR
jgi:DNA-binding CsgD family transcriptional regulator